MFNVRVKRYLNTEQIQIFSQPLLSADSEREDIRKFIRDTGEIVPINRRIIKNCFVENERKIAFDVDYDIVDDYGDVIHKHIEFDETYKCFNQEVGSYMHDE